MPLWIILTKWPAPSWPTWVTHGSPSAIAAIDFRIGPSVTHASSEPPGMIDGPLSAPSSPPEMPAPTKLMPVSRTAFSRRMVSVNSALPPSTMMSPGSKTFDELVDDGIRALAGLHHDERGARLLQRCGELLVVASSGRTPASGCSSSERLGLLVAAVEDRDRVALAAGEVAGEVRAHHRQSDDADVGLGFGFGHANPRFGRGIGFRLPLAWKRCLRSPRRRDGRLRIRQDDRRRRARRARSACRFVDADDAASGGERREDGGRHPARRRRPGAVAGSRRRAARRTARSSSPARRSSARYRDRLRAAAPDLALVFLDGHARPARARACARDHEFMPATLLDSQLATLEPPDRRRAPHPSRRHPPGRRARRRRHGPTSEAAMSERLRVVVATPLSEELARLRGRGRAAARGRPRTRAARSGRHRLDAAAHARRRAQARFEALRRHGRGALRRARPLGQGARPHGRRQPGPALGAHDPGGRRAADPGRRTSTPRRSTRILFTTSAGVHAVPLAEFAVFGVLAGVKRMPWLEGMQDASSGGRASRSGCCASTTVLVVGLG